MATASEVFLLGAGFSKAISGLMPLVNELGSQMPIQGEGLRSIDRIATDFELVLTTLAERQPWLREEENLRNRATFLEVSRRIGRVVTDLSAKTLDEPVPDWLMVLLKYWLGTESWVITFNYDALVEKAFTEYRRRNGEPMLGAIMAHAGLYGIPIPSLLGRTQLVLGHEGNPGLRLLKLHGSVNWRYSGEESAGETIFDIGLTPGWNSDSLEAAAIASGLDKIPLVIPPTLGKSSFLTNESIRGSWRLARVALRQAHRVYALGYSFPESDQNTVALVRQAIRDDVKVVVVNTDAETPARYRRLLDPYGEIDGEFAGHADPIPAFVSSLIRP